MALYIAFNPTMFYFKKLNNIVFLITMSIAILGALVAVQELIEKWKKDKQVNLDNLSIGVFGAFITWLLNKLNLSWIPAIITKDIIIFLFYITSFTLIFDGLTTLGITLKKHGVKDTSVTFFSNILTISKSLVGLIATIISILIKLGIIST